MTKYIDSFLIGLFVTIAIVAYAALGLASVSAAVR